MLLQVGHKLYGVPVVVHLALSKNRKTEHFRILFEYKFQDTPTEAQRKVVVVSEQYDL